MAEAFSRYHHATQKWLTYETGESCALCKYHPKFLGFGLFLKLLRKRAYDPIESVGRVALRIPVQQHIFSRTHLGCYDSPARVIYVHLKAPDNNYGMCKNEVDEADLG